MFIAGVAVIVWFVAAASTVAVSLVTPAAEMSPVASGDVLVYGQSNSGLVRVGGLGPGWLSVADPVGADQLVTVGGFSVHTALASQLEALLDRAVGDGVHLGGWGWRSHTRQHELRRINGCPDGWTHRTGERVSDFSPSGRCRVPTARPGASQHERGLAVDFTCGGLQIAGTRCFRWLEANAADYGFYNLASEPWHWSTTGR